MCKINSYSDFILKRKCSIFWGFLLCNFLITGSLIANNLLGFTEGGNFDWVITNNKISEQNDMLRLAYSETDELDTTEEISERSRLSQINTISLIYNWKDESGDDILTSKNLQSICKIEKVIFNNPLYKDYCYLQNNNCSSIFTSITNVFYPENHNWSCERLTNNIVESKREIMYTNLKNNEQSIFGFFVEKDFEDKTAYTRSLINLGEPLKGYTSSVDRAEEQRDKYREFYSDVNDKFVELFKINTTFFRSGYRDKLIYDDLQVKFYSWGFQTLEFNTIINGDITWTLCSILFVSFWIGIHTGSLFITICSMLQIIFSMPFAFLFYRLIFGITYFTQLHGCVIFLALGIGADDIFVFVDSWKQNKALKNVQLRDRLSLTMSRTINAVFNTSFTTTVAFLATATSPAMPISSFGIYAALTITTNYLFVILFTPTIILVKENYYDKMFLYCKSKKTSEVRDVEMSVKNGESKTEEDLSDNNESNEGNLNNMGCCYSLFGYYFNCLNFKIYNLKIFPIIIISSLLGFGCFNIYQASLLTPPMEQERWFSDDHMFTGFVDSMTNDFKSDNLNQYSEITITWGIDGINRNNYNMWEPNNYRGEVLFKSDFDLNSLTTLNHINYVCNLIEDKDCNHEGCSGYRNKLAIPNTTVCFVNEFLDMYDFNSELFIANLSDFRSNTRPKNNNLKTWKNYIGFVNNELKYVSISFRSTLKTLVPLKIKEPVYDLVENVIITINENTTNKLGNAFQDAGITWVWFDIERNLIQSMFNGLAICFPVSFLVLLFATKNWYLSILSIISIGFVVTNVLGFSKFFMGWNLGIAETVAAVIVIGFSIDYTLHIGHIYQEAYEMSITNREDRTKYALERMGVTVLAGAITTAGSAAFMTLCQLTFFYKMALLITTTILFSLVYSLGFLTSLCILVGPQNNFGNIHFKKCKC